MFFAFSWLRVSKFNRSDSRAIDLRAVDSTRDCNSSYRKYNLITPLGQESQGPLCLTVSCWASRMKKKDNKRLGKRWERVLEADFGRKSISLVTRKACNPLVATLGAHLTNVP